MYDRFLIAAKLREIARLLKVKGENRFKSHAYERAAGRLDNLQADLDRLVAEARLQDIRGVGAGLAAVIDEVYRTGTHAMLEQLKAELPPGASELVSVPGLTVKRLWALHDALRIETVADLRTACEKGLVRNVRGFGVAAEAKILAAIEKLERKQDRLLLHDALEEGGRLLEHLAGVPEVDAVAVAGALRRREETIRRIEIVAAGRRSEALVDRFLDYPPFAERIDRHLAGCAARLANGLEAVLHVATPERFMPSLHYWTGSREHYAALEALAAAKKMQLSADGIRDGNGRTVMPQDEAEIYRRLGLPYIAPEQRDGQGEIEAAARGDLPEPVTAEAIRGMTHCHTTYSDGQNSIEEMALAAERMGMKYLTITDHSPSAFYARGVKVDRLRAQWEEISRVQEKVRIKLLRGTESDILENGALDYPDPILEQFDVIIASVHVRHQMDAGRMTRRLVTALKLPIFKIWGHPLGRLLNSRPPLECHMEEVLDAVAESRAAIEINGDPRRLDLEPRWIRAARRRGIRFVVSTDAHSVRALNNLQFGVAMARRGWLSHAEVLNTMETGEFMKAVRP